MKLITFDKIKNLNISPKLCYEWAEEMILNKDKTLLPPKISIKPTSGVFCNVMPSMILHESKKIGGIKVVTRYPERKPSLDSNILLFNAENGEYLAMLDGDWVTTMRTGAVAAHSILLFAKKNFKTLGMMGLGNVSRATLLILAAMCPDREFNIKLLRYSETEISFAKRFEEYNNIHFTYVDNHYDLVKGSEVVISGATYLPNDICEDEAFDEGVLVVPIHTLGFTNCDLFFDKVFADDTGHVRGFKNFDKFRSFAEVTDVLKGTVKGRENDKERILAYNIGVSIHDINYAFNIYELLSKNGKLDDLADISLNGPTEKYWI